MLDNDGCFHKERPSLIHKILNFLFHCDSSFTSNVLLQNKFCYVKSGIKSIKAKNEVFLKGILVKTVKSPWDCCFLSFRVPSF